MTKEQLGIIGLGVMGENLALNVERNGFAVVGWDLDPAKVESFASRTRGKQARAARSIEEFFKLLGESRKRILMMVPASAVDAAIGDLRRYLVPGDVLIDGGNTLYSETERRMRDLSGSRILYMGVGISGGEEGALLGPSIMPGGDPEAWPLMKPILQAIAAKADDGAPCCDWIGSGGAGHFVKMVHNGIEYGDMQMICEAYALMESLCGMSAMEMSRIFAEWNAGELKSYLVQITADILTKTDPETKQPLVDVILDTAAQKGTGRWTTLAALDLGVPAPTIADSVFARVLSGLRTQRIEAARVLTGPPPKFDIDGPVLVEQIRKALFCSKICSYAQGFQLLRGADAEYGYELRFSTIASLWRAGCIIRAQFLDRIKEAYDRDPSLANLFLDGYFRELLATHQAAWRSVVALAAQQGIWAPTFMSALAYYDGYRTSRLSANLLQAQRDYFGAHTYQRVDKEGTFHTRWAEV